MAEHIELCPYCGEDCSLLKEENISGYYLFFIECTYCRAQGPKFFDKDKVIKIWNEFSQGIRNNSILIWGYYPFITRLDIEKDFCCEQSEKWDKK